MSPDRARLAQLVGAPSVELRPLSSGTSRQTFEVSAADGRSWVLQQQLAGDTRSHLPAATEATLLRAAAACGVPVPPVVAASDDLAVLGRPFVLTERVGGESIPRRILRDPGLTGARGGLAHQLGQAVAHLQEVEPPAALGPPVGALDALRAQSDELDLARPAMELGWSWLRRHQPPPGRPVLVHGDLRLGNVLVDEGGLAAVLDWELAHVGDPVEDLGWLCVPSWRFGEEAPVGGVGTVEDLLAGYASVRPGAVPDLATHRWWVVFGTLRWGVICADQARTALAGAVASHELAVIGRRIAETERDLLVLTREPGEATHPAPPGEATHPAPAGQPASPPPAFDLPSAGELLAALDGWLADLGVGLTGAAAYQARVARTLVGIVRREVTLGPALLSERRHLLAGIGARSEADLAAAIRSGAADEAAVRPAVTRITAGRLEVNDPVYRGASEA